MKFLEEHRLAITILTPVHIGCGEDYTPTDYVIDEDTLFAFNSAVVSQTFNEYERDGLVRLVQGKQQDDVLQRLQKFFRDHREPLIAEATHYLPVANGVASLYRDRTGHTAGREDSGKLEIERTFYNPVSQKPVIPGSSLKGAIRTALLSRVNDSEPLSYKEKQAIRNPQENVNQKLQNQLFEFESLEQDPMRLVQLADTEVVKSDKVSSQVVFAVNRPRQKPKQNHAGQKGPQQMLEILSESGPRAFSSRLTLQKVGQLQQSQKLPKTDLQWSIQQIADACNHFYFPLLEHEMKIIREREYVSPDWDKRMRQLLAGIRPMLDANKAILLRIGKHSGAEAVTLNGVRDIKIMKGKGAPEYKSHPTTVWFSADTKDQLSRMTPFGWALIEIDPPDMLPQSLKNFAVTGQDNDGWQQWLEKTRQRIEDARKKCEVRKIQAEDQKRKQLAEKEESRKKAERLAAMTPQQKELEELRELFEKEKAHDALRAGGDVANRTSNLLKNAPGWPEKEDRHAAADLIEEIYKAMGPPKGEKGRERKGKIKELRES